MKCFLNALIATALMVASSAAIEFKPVAQLRRPIALTWLDQANLAIANRRGTISFLDVVDLRIVDEVSVAGRLSDLHAIDDKTIAALDEASHELIMLSRREGSWHESSRISISHTPVRFAFSLDRKTATIASLWSQRLTVVDFSVSTAPKIEKIIDLPFAPRVHLHLNEHEALVAAAFGGQLAIVNLHKGSVIRKRDLKASHNLAGIAMAGRSRVLMPHLMLNHEQATTGSNVHWGDVMSNVVRTVDLDWFRSTADEETTAADLYYLGHPDDATGDPTGILLTTDGRQIIAFAGINQMGISDVGANSYRRIPVGRRPAAFALGNDESLLYVANQFDDSISIVDVNRRRVIDTVSLGPTPELSLSEQGEILFFDSTLSSDGWFSCHSCHANGHSNGQLSDTFGDNYRGSPKRVLSLLGTADTGPWAWNGKVKSLEGQIRKSIETTMRGEAPTPEQVTALAAYLATLPPAPAVDAARGTIDHAATARGKQIFDSLGCADCHQPQAYTSLDVYDVGLEDAEGNREFNPPSLVGVSQRVRLLHDRQAQSYQEALQIHPLGKPIELGEQEWSDLTRFLNSL